MICQMENFPSSSFLPSLAPLVRKSLLRPTPSAFVKIARPLRPIFRLFAQKAEIF